MRVRSVDVRAHNLGDRNLGVGLLQLLFGKKIPLEILMLTLIWSAMLFMFTYTCLLVLFNSRATSVLGSETSTAGRHGFRDLLFFSLFSPLVRDQVLCLEVPTQKPIYIIYLLFFPLSHLDFEPLLRPARDGRTTCTKCTYVCYIGTYSVFLFSIILTKYISIIFLLPCESSRHRVTMRLWAEV